jgi:hypothetical protein
LQGSTKGNDLIICYLGEIKADVLEPMTALLWVDLFSYLQRQMLPYSHSRLTVYDEVGERKLRGEPFS